MGSHTPSSLDAATMNRRSLLKRAGLLGVGLPVAGMFVNACGSSNAPQPAANIASIGNAAPAAPVELTVTAKDLKFEPDELSAVAGQPVRITFVNTGAIEHDWDIPGMPVSDLQIVAKPDGYSQRMADLLAQNVAKNTPYAGAGPGQQMIIEFTPTTAGVFEMGCMVPGHKAAGMHGTFTVAPAAAAPAAPAANADHQQHDDHVMPSTAPASGTPYDAERLAAPQIAPPIGKREPQLVQAELEIVEKIGYLDNGVAYEFWTFGGTIPGPMLRARVGDTVELTLKNPPTSKMAHNIDLHAVSGPGGGGAVTQVGPGQSATFRFKALNPGVYVYHCATAPIPQHISSGMYGLIVIEPEEGLAPVDREFYIMQGDFYLDGQRGEQGLRGFSIDKLYDERPDYIVFNGAVGALLDERALHANVGETARIFFGVGGPNTVSSFHVIGAILERVAQQGASEWSTNVQTTLVPAGGAMMAELTFKVPGNYTLVDHSLGRLGKGAVGMIVVAGEEQSEIFTQTQAPG